MKVTHYICFTIKNALLYLIIQCVLYSNQEDDWKETSASEFKMIPSLNHGLKLKNGK